MRELRPARELGLPVWSPTPDAGSADLGWLEDNDLVLWIESVRAVVVGDTLVDYGDGLEVNEAWVRERGGTRDAVVALLHRPRGARARAQAVLSSATSSRAVARTAAVSHVPRSPAR